MKKIILLFTLVFCFIGITSSLAQSVETADYSNPNPASGVTVDVGDIGMNFQIMGGVVYENGPYFDTPGGGFGGGDLSTLENTTLGENVLGFGHSTATGFRIADDWEVTETVDVTSIDFYAYQTGSTTTTTIDFITLQIWDGDPSDPASTIIYGDDISNALSSSDWSGAYRATEADPTGNTRPIMVNRVETSGLTLTPGTYWLDWNTGGSLGSGPWAPPITILGSSETGNALQFDPAVGWSPVLDFSTGAGTNTPQGFPFSVTGSVLSLVDNTLDGFAYYPNPVRNVLNVNAQANIENISIYNVLGQELINISPNALYSKIDIANLSTGLYVMKATVDGVVGSFNLIKK